MHVKILGRGLPVLLAAFSGSLLLAVVVNGQGGLVPRTTTHVPQRAGQQIVGQRSPFTTVAERRRSPSEYVRSPEVTGGVAEHPLSPALRWAREGLVDVRNVQDYECTFVKRERIDGELGEHEYAHLKVRHKPFSVYMGFLAPARVKGQEAIWVEGKNDGKLWGHPNGLRHKLVGTVSLPPTSPFAMMGNRYPITEAGILNMTERLVEIGEKDLQYAECEVKFIEGAKINPGNRICTCIQVVHPIPRRNFLFNMARIYVDEELNLPVRYEAYDWPKVAGEEPVLTEEYTYINLKLNNGFTDADFDINNSKYKFK
jgi:hypothetical protein